MIIHVDVHVKVHSILCFVNSI